MQGAKESPEKWPSAKFHKQKAISWEISEDSAAKTLQLKLTKPMAEKVKKAEQKQTKEYLKK